MKRNLKRHFAAFLSAVILLSDCTAGYATGIDQTVLETTNESETFAPPDAVEENFLETNESAEELPKVLFEMEELRETSAKQFRLSDGTILAAQYGMDVHYENEEGAYEEIDNRFLYETAESVTDFDGYTTAEGTVEFKFAPQVQDGDILKVSEGEYSVGFELLVPTDEDALEVAETSELEEMELSDETVFYEESLIPEVMDDVEQSTEPASITVLKGEILNREDLPLEMEILLADDNVMTMAAEEDVETSEEIRDVPEVIWTDVAEVAPTEGDTALLESLKADKAVTSVGYGNVIPGISLQYVLAGSSLKEYILVNQVQESYSYDFRLNLENLMPELQEDGGILLKDIAKQEVIYEIPTGYMKDAAGAHSDAVEMNLRETENADGTTGWILNITGNAEWINAEERAFPVQIDPTLVHSVESENSFNGNYVTKGHPVESHGNWDYLKVGYDVKEEEMKSFVQLRKLPTLPKNSVVCSAVCYFVVFAYSHLSYSRMNVYVRKITGNNAWGTKYTWRSQPTVSDTVLDYRMLHGDSEGNFVGFNITELIKEHYMTSNSNSDVSGFSLEVEEVADMDAQDWANTVLVVDDYDIYPIMQIVYRDTKGVEGYYTYQTHSLGNAGTAYVGDYNSQLTLIKPIGSYESTIMSYGLNLVYNSSFADRNFTNDGNNLHTGNFTSARTGPGWKLSAQETVVEVSIEDSSEEGSATWLVYNDSDGTEHYFKKKEGSTTEFEDEDGLELTITKNGIDFTMKDKKGNEKFFRAGYLQRIKDASGNIVHIVYNYGTPGNNKIDSAKSNPITSIWVEPKSKNTTNAANAVEIFHITYNDSGYVNTIEEMFGKKYRIGYGMGSDGYSYPQIIYCLNESTNAWVQQVSYGYATDDLLSVITDLETNRGVTYSYAKSPTGYRISSWVECAGTSGASKGIRVSVTADEIRKTVYRDYGADRKSGTADEKKDDILTVYLFNSFGHTINIYSTDAEGKFLGVTAAAYEQNSGTSKKNNRMSNSIAGGQAGVNLLLNGSFEKYGSDSKVASGWNKSGAGSAERKTSNSRSGSANYNMTNSGVSTSAVISKTVALQAGVTYTASAYVNTQGATSFASDGGAFMKVLNSSNVQVAQGTVLASKTDSEVDKGWQRISVTFTPSAGGNYAICIQWKNAAGTIRVDDVQLEEETAPSSYNHIYNASFENGNDGWLFTSFGQEQISTGDKLHGDRSFRAEGYPGTKVYAQQVITLGKKSDTTFLLSGWSKGDSVPELEKNLDDDTKRFWGLSLTLQYSDGKKERHDLPFNEFIHQWQYASMAVVPKRSGQTISTAILRLCYYNNENAAFFDSISLTEEPCQTYKYDDKGNVTSVTSTGNGEETYKYNSTQDLMSVATAGSGTYSYEYNSRHLPTKVTNDNVYMLITYDNDGQSTSTTLNSSHDSALQMKSSAVYSNGLLTRQQDNTGMLTKYGYNDDRERITVTYADIQTIESFRDTMWDRTDRTYQSNWTSVKFGYTNGNPGTITRSGYIGYGQATKYNQIYGFSYDEFGNRTGVTLKAESRNKANNDSLNISSDTKTLAGYSYYSGNGNLKKMTYGAAADQLATVDYTYDKLERVSSVKYTNYNPQKTTTYGYQYSSDGNLSGITVNGTLGYTYEYDSLGRLIYSAKLQNNRPVLYTSHRYDTSNRIARQMWKVGTDTFEETYTYNEKDGTLSQIVIRQIILYLIHHIKTGCF